MTKSIHLLVGGNGDKHFAQQLLHPLTQAFGMQIELTDAVVDVQPFLDRERNQYNSTSMLEFIKKNFATSPLLTQRQRDSKTYLLVTGGDLFIPVLTYVFGEAELEGNVAVVSYYRLQNERYGLPPNQSLLIERLLKEAVHELGHTFGLVHCRTPDCVMHTSTYVEDIDLKKNSFCNPCNLFVEKYAARIR